MASIEELTECPRCSAMVDRMARHERWHRQVEGTSDPLPPDPGDTSGEVYSYP